MVIEPLSPGPTWLDFFRLFSTAINSAIANNPQPIGMMEMLCVTIYPNVNERVSNNMKIHHDHIRTFCGRLTNEPR